jgi:hypothetical protein
MIVLFGYDCLKLYESLCKRILFFVSQLIENATLYAAYE